jgi:hypothetical protein
MIRLFCFDYYFRLVLKLASIGCASAVIDIDLASC